jgi:methylenetetrahydrofolate--tRNA-(uracil-5-)-methyltransferase
LSAVIQSFTGKNNLFFFDAIAPIVAIDSVDFDIAFRGSRYDRGTTEEGDYINCPLNEDEYQQFISALTEAERIEVKEVDLLMLVDTHILKAACRSKLWPRGMLRHWLMALCARLV